MAPITHITLAVTNTVVNLILFTITRRMDKLAMLWPRSQGKLLLGAAQERLHAACFNLPISKVLLVGVSMESHWKAKNWVATRL